MYKLALDLTGGNANDAMLLAHNTLRSMARSGNSTTQLGPRASALAVQQGKKYTTDDVVGTGVDFEPAFFDKYLQPMRKGNENGGPWYHLFGMDKINSMWSPFDVLSREPSTTTPSPPQWAPSSCSAACSS